MALRQKVATTALLLALFMFMGMIIPTPIAPVNAEDSNNTLSQNGDNEQNEGENLVVNGSFEDISDGMPTNWSTWTPIGSPTIGADTDVFHSGQASLKISADHNGRAAVHQSISVSSAQKGKTYKFKAMIKTEDVTGSALNRIQFVNRNNSRVPGTPHIKVGELKGTNDWTLVERIIEIPDHEDVVGVKIENFLEEGTGTVWFDDVSLVPWHPLESIQFDDDKYTLMPDETVTLSVSFTPENTSDKRLEWSSSDNDVVTVDEGVITAHSDGIAVITATTLENNKSARCVIIVGGQSGITVSDYEVETQQGSGVSGTIEAVSDKGSPLSYWKAIDSDHGVTYVAEDGNWSYYPDVSFSGNDSFIVAVEDEEGSYAISRVNVTIHAVNSAPTVEKEGIYPTDKNSPVSGKVTANDPDDDPLTFTVGQPPEHGEVTMDEDGEWTYTPDTDYTGADSFTVNVSDDHGESDTGIVRLYVAPTAEEIVAEIKEKNPENRHPRILAEESDFERIRNLLETDENVQTWFARVKREADRILPQPPAEYDKPDGVRLDTTASRRIVTLAFVYQVTGDNEYAERAWEELEYVSGEAYPDWSPQHFLDTGTMTYGVSVGYDWLYDYLNDDQREPIRQAIIQKGLEPAVPMYIDKTSRWVYSRHNWNFVCNAGMTLGALAIADEEEELAGTILREAFKSIQYGLTQYAPDGSAIEGPSYWEYGTIYLTYFLSSLETSVQHDFGFSDREGLPELPRYPMYISGPGGAFNYSDNYDTLVPGRLLLWFAKQHHKPEYTWYHKYFYSKTGNIWFHDILWYRPEIYDSSEPTELDQYFDRPKLVTMRNSWSDPNALFVGFKGGVNGSSHGDLDTGSFVLDAHGVRWAMDLGRDDYNLPGYWDYDEERWNYYRKRAEGHNTLVIQPSEKADQDVKAVSEIVHKELDRPQGAFAITDMTPAYQKQAASVKRGTALIDHRRQFLVQDEVKAKVPSELYWFMHTRANIEVGESGTSAILTQGDKRLWVQILSPSEASFSVMDAEPLATSPNPDGQTPNLGVKKLAVHMEDVLESTLSIWMVPLMPGDPLPENPPSVVPLDQWEVPDRELAELTGIMVDGNPLTDFDPNRYVYELQLPSGQERVPDIQADVQDSRYQVTVRQAEQIPGVARIEVVDPDGVKDKGIYYVSFVQPKEYGIPVDRPALSVSSVTASDHDGNVPENTIDGNLHTRWSAFGEQWIQYDLEEAKEVSAVSIAWHQGSTRSSFFNIEVSEDGERWQMVYAGSSSGETEEHELYTFSNTEARYVRINGFGNNRNQWNSISETGIYGPKEDIVEKLSKLMNEYEQSDDLKKPLVTQLRTKWKQAQHHFGKGSKEQAIKYVEDFLKKLHDEEMQEFISEDAKEELDKIANVVIELWSR